MGSRKVDKSFLEVYKDLEISYPFCYKSKNGKNFFRYLEDGRYEYLCLEDKKSTLSFGCRSNSIDHLLEEKDFYFKVIANLNEVITNEEFEFQRKLFSAEYEKYLSGMKYISMGVEKIIREKQKEEEKIEKQIDNNDIISGNIEDSPF